MDNEYQRLLNETKEYAKLRYDMLRLELLEKTTKVVSTIIVAIISTVLGLTALVYFSFAIIFYIDDFIGGTEWGFCIFGCIFLLLVLILAIFSKQLILNPLIKHLSGVLFTPEDKDDESETKK
ncbi:MAG: phage holin family protein [Paludibacteraceae bacterium]|nr:phage holin family protein [Paludibacteraceae bacterium]